MKKIFSTLTLMLAAAALFAANAGDQLTLSFSTSGPDFYKDGTPVAVGETYLLVYVNQAATFAGVQMDGALVDPVNNRIATTASAVAGSKCGFKAIQYPNGLFPENGSWSIVLLDTRTDSGAPGGLVAAQGTVSAGPSASSASTTLASLNGSAQGGLVASTASRVPAGLPVPAITDLSLAAGKANLRIADFADNVIYQVETTTDLTNWAPAQGASRVQGKTSLALEGKSGLPELAAAADVSADDTVRFFRVIVSGSN